MVIFQHLNPRNFFRSLYISLDVSENTIDLEKSNNVQKCLATDSLDTVLVVYVTPTPK